MYEELIFELINRYYENETNTEEENYLFSVLSNNDEAKKYFKGFLFLQNSKELVENEVPYELDEKIKKNIDKSPPIKSYSNSLNSKRTYITATLSVVLLFLTILFYTEKENFKDEFINASKSNAKQERIIEALYQSLPSAVVESKENYEVIVGPL